MILSAALAAFGIASAFWPRLVEQDPVAWIAAGVIVGVVAVSEAAASLLLVHAANRAAEREHAWAWAARLAFIACTAANVLAGHYGAEAINTRLVSPQRAPFESALSSAEALLELAQNTKVDIEARHAREIAGLEREFEAERQTNPTFVTTRGRQQEEQRAAMRARQAAELREAQGEISRATEGVSDAQANMERAPAGFAQEQMWGFAALLELLKGLLVRVATPSRRRRRVEGAVIPIDPAAYAEMTEDELQAILSHGRSVSALAQHALRRRQQAA
ncbi:hypothetical protein U91I_02730 [alpha proteobacterium U9-1i]|nr:hypothetical protein U91I_02730 [alpha proteobacterium U9-1i]